MRTAANGAWSSAVNAATSGARCHDLGMPRRLPRVANPLVPVLERDGVTILLVSVEAWPDEVVVRMRGLPSEVTARVDAEFHEALEAWHREGRASDMPPQPAEHVFGFDITLSDDEQTSYSAVSAARGGSRTMFRADWTFHPGPPDSARRLTVRVGDRAETEIDLASS
jgi:hypothetical protein